MNDILARCLGDLEARINPVEEERLLQEWRVFTDGGFEGDIFWPRRRDPAPPRVQWPAVGINEALEDFDAMALQQYAGCSATLSVGSGAMLNVRSNYGSSILPLLFGVEPFVMDPKLNTLPTSRPLNDVAAIRRIVGAGIPDLETGYGARVLEMGRHFAAVARQYPKIGKYVRVYHPDLQGPMDVCEVVWGSSMFYALYDDPELVHALLHLVTETYIAFLSAWAEIVPFAADGNSHWGLYHKGQIMLRDDSAMNVSPAQFEEFIRPYDQRLLDAFGGGAIHFCGRGDHYIASMCETHHLNAINLSQPELNNMETIWSNTVDRGIKVIGLRRDAAEAALSAGRPLRGQVHCW